MKEVIKNIQEDIKNLVTISEGILINSQEMKKESFEVKVMLKELMCNQQSIRKDFDNLYPYV